MNKMKIGMLGAALLGAAAQVITGRSDSIRNSQREEDLRARLRSSRPTNPDIAAWNAEVERKKMEKKGRK